MNCAKLAVSMQFATDWHSRGISLFLWRGGHNDCCQLAAGGLIATQKLTNAVNICMLIVNKKIDTVPLNIDTVSSNKISRYLSVSIFSYTPNNNNNNNNNNNKAAVCITTVGVGGINVQ